MVQSLDFTLGIIFGIVIGVISNFIANYLIYNFRERKRRELVVRAFISELVLIQDNNRDGFYKSIVVETPVFSKLITELPLLKADTVEMLLNTYSFIKFYLRPEFSMTIEQKKELKEDIETSISFLREEIQNKSRITQISQKNKIH